MPSPSTVTQPLSRRFFMATLTLGLLNSSSAAMSMERTDPFLSWRIRMVSR